jgi:uncharacterized membrane protein
MNMQEALRRTLRSWVNGVEGNRELDSYVSRLDAPVRVLVGTGWQRDFWQGRWLGHSFHPLLTDFPLGAWASASFLDLFGGKDTRTAAETLVAFGVVAALPTALAGMADWSGADKKSKRVGLVHATLNGTVLACYATSLVARRRQRHGLGVGLGLAGGLIAWVSGYLGGHLSLVRDAGRDREFR